MALDLLKGKNFLFFNSADYLSTVEFYLMSFVFRIFGPSIPLGGSIMLLEWSIAVGIGVYLFIQSTSKSQGSFAGLVAAVGVPYTMTYATVPSDSAFIVLSMLLLLETYLIVEKGETFLKLLIFGFTMGAAYFISKKCFPAIITCGLVMVCVSNSVWQFKKLLKPSVFVPLIMAAFVGYLPEFWYELYHPSQSSFFGVVPAAHILENLRVVCRCVWAYFDAQPSSRMQDGFHYWLHLGDLKIHPQSFGDYCCYLISTSVLVLIFVYFFISYSKKNAGLLLLSGLTICNLLLMSASGHIGMNGNNIPRRYLLMSSIPFSLWTGFLFFKCGDYF